MVEGDIVQLGDHPRRVVEVRRSPGDDAVRCISVARMKCGYARAHDGTIKSYCTGPVHLWRTELKGSGPYRFRGYRSRARG